MSFAGLLNTSVAISRFTKTGEDGNGQPTGTWATVATVPCRIEPSAGQEIESDKEVVISTHRMFLEFGVSITEADRAIVGGDEYNVLLVKNAGGVGHHLEVELEKIQ